MDREDNRVSSRIVVEYRLAGRIGKNAAVPVEFAVDAHRRKGGRKSPRSHDMPDVEPAIAGVEIAHPAGSHMRRAHSQARPSLIDQVEVHEFSERVFEWSRRVVASAVGAQRKGVPGMGKRVRYEKAGNALSQRAPLRPAPIESEERALKAPVRLVLYAAPECVQPLKSVLWLVSGYKTRVDGADRGPDDPVRLDPGLLQRLIHTGLVGSQCTASLQHENDLARQLAGDGARESWRMVIGSRHSKSPCGHRRLPIHVHGKCTAAAPQDGAWRRRQRLPRRCPS